MKNSSLKKENDLPAEIKQGKVNRLGKEGIKLQTNYSYLQLFFMKLFNFYSLYFLIFIRITYLKQVISRIIQSVYYIDWFLTIALFISSYQYYEKNIFFEYRGFHKCVLTLLYIIKVLD